MKEMWLKNILVIVSYLAVGLLGLSAAVFLSTRFLLPALAQEGAGPEAGSPVEAGEAAAPTEASTPQVLEPVPGTGEGSAEKKQTLTVDDLNRFLRVYEYAPGGRRDPFQRFLEQKAEEAGGVSSVADEELSPLQRFDLDQIQLLGIIWQVSKPKVMMRDPTGQVHIVGKDTKVGKNNGYIAVIREGELVIVESFEDEGQVTYKTRIMKLSR